MTENIGVFVSLLNNISIFIVLVAGYGYLIFRLERYSHLTRTIALGLFFGLIAIGSMHIKIPVVEGVIVDQRNAIVVLSGAFGGPVSGIVSATMAGLFRAYLGGSGVVAGVFGLFLSALAGAILFRLRRPDDHVGHIAAGALFGVIFTIPGFLLVGDWAYGWELMQRMSLPWGGAIYVGLFIGGLMLAREDRRQRLEAEKKRTDDRYRNLFENSEVALWNVDYTNVMAQLDELKSQGVEDLQAYFIAHSGKVGDISALATVTDVNAATVRLFNAPSKQAFLTEINKIFVKGTGPFFKEHLIALWRGDKTFRSELALQTFDGHPVTAIVSFSFPSNLEALDQVPVAVLDITDRKAAERARDLALNEAEKANRAKSGFLAAMSHELRTPLNAILGFSDILRKQYFGPPGGGKYKEYAGYINTSGEHLLALVDDLLDISTIEAGRRSLNPVDVDVCEAIKDGLTVVETRAAEKNLNVSLSCPDGMPPVFADRRALHQVLLNLLSNAVKYSPENSSIDVVASHDNECHSIVIRDEGGGIPDSLLKDIVNPFVRGKQNPQTADDGWGLGLSIAKSLVDLHGGTLSLRNRSGQGTEVRIFLPVRPEDARVEAEADGADRRALEDAVQALDIKPQ